MDRLHAADRRDPLARRRPDLWIMGLIVAGLGTILGAVNMITTVVCMRARA
ncbi:cytochrome C and Quinol oxidase polypeptide I family protein [Mycobacterium xenopi 3993]|nr:cytochrome C and Quinol oxidase polypeptide I family protein [Mycobacterium xenopi 3993]